MASDEDTPTQWPRDWIVAQPSSASRQPHDTQLGNFELPPPPMHYYSYTQQSLSSHSLQAPTTIASVGNLLTPPSTIQVDLIGPTAKNSSTTTLSDSAVAPVMYSAESPWSYGNRPTSLPQHSNFPYSTGSLPTEQRGNSAISAGNSDRIRSHSPKDPPVISSTYSQRASDDRPFKCDQCPQSFDRNHDLKRHKRIHLAVKPFPCTHCDKSFSRSDALKRHILVKGCGRPAADVDDSKRDHGSSKAIEVEMTSLVFHEPKLEHPKLEHPKLEHPKLEHPTIRQSDTHKPPQKPTVSNEVKVPGRVDNNDPYTSSQEPTVSNIVKVLERIIDAAKKLSENNLGEYVEAWTGFDLCGTDLLRRLCLPASFQSPTSRTKAVTEYVHAVLVVAQWRDYVGSRERRLSLSHSRKSTPFRANVDLPGTSATSVQDDEIQMPPRDKELRLTTLTNSLERLWFFEVLNRTVDAFLYRWSTEHQRWLQYRWNAACAIYYCKLHIDEQRWKYLDWNGVELHSVIAKVLASSQANVAEPAKPSGTFIDDGWVSIQERRRLQNRIAQRNYRKKLRARLFELEERANAKPQTGHDSAEASSSAESKEQIDPEVMVYQDADETVNMSCICDSSSDQRFIIACLKCGTWQHIACYYESAKDYMDEHRCVQCAPRLVEPKVPSSKRPANVAFSVYSSSTEYRSNRRVRTLGAESSIGHYEREGSEKAYTEPTIYNDHEWRTLTSTANKEAEPVVADALTNFDAREWERVKEKSIKNANRSTNLIIECPISAVESDLGLPGTCFDLQAGSLSQIRIHLLRRHNINIKYCDICAQDILDPELFELCHGSHCRDPRLRGSGIIDIRQQWKELYMSFRRKTESTAMETSEGSYTYQVNTGPSLTLNAANAFSLPTATDSLPEGKEEFVDFNEKSGADCTNPKITCHCSSSSETSTDPTVRHALMGLADKLPCAWEDIQDQLPESYKWDIEYVITQGQGGADSGCWTCAPLQGSGPEQIPLTIAGAPVVLPVEHQWPPVGGIHPPPDPRPSALINCWTELPIDTIRDLFLTFEGSLGFYVLISGFLQIIVAETFDTTWASSHLPHRYGGLKVCYITNTIESTMLQSNVATTPRTSALLETQTSRLLSSSKQARSTQSLQLNDFIEARVSSTSREKFAGRIGLKVAKDGQLYLVMSSHIITEAILSKSFFGLNRDPMKRLQEDWNRNAEIWAGNAKIGTIEKSYDHTAEYYPNGFNHDVTLIRPNATASVAEIKSPVAGVGWLCRDAWSSLRQQPSALKILGATDTDRAAKCIKCNTTSEAIIVGEGIFFNQTATAGAKPVRSHDLSTWNRFVSRAVLYRVNPDFNPSSGYSGIALYAEGSREDGTQGPGIVGFQSFVQRSDHPQKFSMPEGQHLERRLKEGRVAFYGAFQVPDELRREYSIL